MKSNENISYINPIAQIHKNKIVAVIRAENAKDAIEKVNALYLGGIKVFEITVEKESVLPALAEINLKPDVTVMAGGVITSMRAQQAIDVGASAIVSPVFQGGLLKFCLGKSIPHIATVSTPNEAYNAWKSRIPIIKIFPAKSMGQVEYIEDILRPMPFLDLMPSGGVNLDDFVDYLQSGAVAVGIGRCFYKDASLKEITERAKYATSQLVKLNK
jgi:2-dehydro-3-deoxyphosphogluconate aldolase/(4S)-4-hydroxy-2-oxoglutarate aldolase